MNKVINGLQPMIQGLELDSAGLLRHRILNLLSSMEQEIHGDGEVLNNLKRFLDSRILHSKTRLNAMDRDGVRLCWEGEDHYHVRALNPSHNGALIFGPLLHKDAEKHLFTELHDFIKNQVLSLDQPDLNALDQIQEIKQLGARLIRPLASIENLRKKIWLKKKFVRDVQYCVTLNRAPKSLFGEIAANKAQVEDWASCYARNKKKEDPEFPEEVSLAFLEANPTLVVDTSFFDASFKQKLLSHYENLDDRLDGILIKGDNFHSLNLIGRRFKDKIRMIYIDPPFNTEGGGFLYQDRFTHSDWLTLMDNRLALARELLTKDGTFYAHIDYNEKERLRLLLDRRLHYITEIIWRIGWLSGFKTKANKFIRNHDTIYQYSRSETPFFMKTYIPYPEGYRRRDGKKPKGKGYPLEDTWNCSPIDSLNSIQIMSFSREKVGDDQLTQKNENLLSRMILSSSEEGDWVMDYFLGSGTTTAVAQKLGRRWIGMELGAHFDKYLLPRMKQVLHGDRYGVSMACNWTGGGMFKFLRLESYEQALDNRGLYSLEQDRIVLNPEAFEKPDEGMKETFNWLLGLSVSCMTFSTNLCLIQGEDPDSRSVLVVWRDSKDADLNEVASLIQKKKFHRVYLNGPNEPGLGPTISIEDAFQELMFESQEY